MRHSAISDLDPIALGLAAITNCSIRDRLPLNHEIETIDGLVVVAPSIRTAGFSQGEIEAAISQARKAGRTVPILALASGEKPGDEAPSSGISWRSSVSLSEVAGFVETLNSMQPIERAA